MTAIEAIYQNGVFKPLGNVTLPENQRVTVVVAAPDSPPAEQQNDPGVHSRRSLQDLVGSVPLNGQPPSDEDCDRLREEALKEKYC